MEKEQVDLQRGVPGDAGHPCPLADAAAVEFIRRFQGAMNWCINSYAVPEPDRDDVRQDVSLKVLKRFRKYGGLAYGDTNSTYIYAITRSMCMAYWQRRNRHRICADGEDERLASTALPVDQWLERQQAHERLHLAIATLPPMSRAVMREVLLGKNLKEVAEHFEITLANAKVIAHRARLLLRKRLAR